MPAVNARTTRFHAGIDDYVIAMDALCFEQGEPVHGYTKTAKVLHWLMAILLFGLAALGFYMHDLPLSPEKCNCIPGTNGPASPPSCSSPSPAVPGAWPIRLPAQPLARQHARNGCSLLPMPATLLLYVLMIAIPLSGWLMSFGPKVSDRPFPACPIPDMLGKTRRSATCWPWCTRA